MKDDPDLHIIHVLVNHTKNLLRNTRDKINDNTVVLTNCQTGIEMNTHTKKKKMK